MIAEIRRKLAASGEPLPRACKRETEADARWAGYADCTKCENTGTASELREDGWRIAVVCECQAVRANFARLDASGIRSSLESLTFENYRAEHDWQEAAKSTAMGYCGGAGGWLFLGGQVGSGKTHLGTAVLGQFVRKFAVRYMLWRDEIVKIKANVNNDPEYQALVYPLKAVDVLYVDDFFKTERNSGKRELPTAADVKFAHELLNYRYVEKKRTIISSELFIDDILEIDEAVGSRIYQMSKGHCVEIGYDKNKNWRLRT